MCMHRILNTYYYFQNEINVLQNRLQRCVMDCNDSARDRLGPDPSQETVNIKHITIFR